MVLTSVQLNQKGVFFLIGDDEGWGKIKLLGDGALSPEYRKKKGRLALKHLQGLKEVLFYFQPPRASDHARPRGRESDGVILAQDFFFYFNIVSQGLGSGARPEMLDPGPVAAPVRSPATDAVQKKVLVVDDSALARKAARFALEGAGLQVVEAWDGFEALGQLQKQQPDLVLLDLIMPGLDGYKVLDLIRANKRYRLIPVVILTARDGLIDKLKGRFSGTNEYLTKPFKPQQLLEVVDKLI